MARDTTLLDLVSAVAASARSDAEVIATVVYLVNSGRVRRNGYMDSQLTTIQERLQQASDARAQEAERGFDFAKRLLTRLLIS